MEHEPNIIETHTTATNVTDRVIRIALIAALLLLTFYDVIYRIALADYLAQIGLPREILFTIASAQIIGALLLFMGMRIFLTAVLLSINCIISAVCLSSVFSWVLMAGFLVLAMHTYNRGGEQRYCDPLIK